MEKDLFTPIDRNGRQYKIDMLVNTVREWAEKTGWTTDSDKDVNYFCQREKNARKYDKRKEYGSLSHSITDPKFMFIDYINLLRP